ncbi:hypothetical protein PPSIR1_21054 [Plesiocystis pacifica SIR-1]|uniref:Uncharacterized protein n=1 Tax=Plesiocystis pacifica SIR-1 TaxID=391625 RepID=A6G3F0_9BACT|nr:hypothetical protein [Plesiocystis pacifica]EDM79557.1 hypothetical protein PPSIR1_21054 [Plesiocystis pacifica SIR-1]
MLDRLAARLCLLSPALLGLSCQAPPDISGELEYFADVYNVSVGLRCECHQEYGYASGPECEEGVGSIDLERRGCIADALEGHEEGAKGYLECVNDALDVLVACLEADNECIEGAGMTCLSDYDTTRAGCSGLASVQRDSFQACLP